MESEKEPKSGNPLSYLGYTKRELHDAALFLYGLNTGRRKGGHKDADTG